jgi:hypothetical protein
MDFSPHRGSGKRKTIRSPEDSLRQAHWIVRSRYKKIFKNQKLNYCKRQSKRRARYLQEAVIFATVRKPEEKPGIGTN